MAIRARQRRRAVGMSATADQAQTSIAYVALWTRVIDVALDTALATVTNLSARTVDLIMTTGSAETDLVALAQTVTRNHGLGAID